MNIDLLTKDDLKQLKDEILQELLPYFETRNEKKEWLKTNEVKQLLNCSNGTLLNLRIQGKLRPTKVNGTLYYSRKDIDKMFNSGMIFAN